MPIAYSVAEFSGRDNLVAAAEVLLADSQLSSVVVRDVGPNEGIEFEAASAAKPKDVYDHIPGLTGVNTVMAKWWETNSVSGFRFTPSICQVFQTRGGIKAHIDRPLYHNGAVDGPITMSLRIDTDNELERQYNCMPVPNGHDLLARGYIIAKRLHELNSASRRLDHNALSGLGYTSIQQKPGDLVMFRNFPEPTYHAVWPIYSDSRALVFSYALKSTTHRSTVAIA